MWARGNRVGFVRWLAFVLLAIAPMATAQVPPDVGPPEREPAGDDAPEVPAESEPLERAEPVTWIGEQWWVDVGPRGVEAFSSVAIHPERADIWAVSTLQGAVWVTVDGGVTWIEVLGGLPVAISDDEQVILDIQARVEELVGDPGNFLGIAPDELDEDELSELEDAQDLAQSAADEALSGLQSELEADPWFLEQQAALRGEAGAARPRVWFSRAGLLVAGRADGLRVSTDLGATWIDVLPEPVTAFAERGDGTWVAGTPRGLWSSPDGVRWSPVSAFGGERVYDLVADLGLYIATDAGVWFTPDGIAYQQLRVFQERALTVRPVVPAPTDAPVEPRALVIGALDTLWRGLRPDEPANPVFGGPIPESQDVVRIRDERLLAASTAGPFESLDRGRTWAPLLQGLEDERTRAIAVRDDLVLLVGALGVYQLEPIPEELDFEQPVELPTWVPLTALMDSALGRRELNQELGSRAVAALMPQVVLEYRRQGLVRDDWSEDRGYTVRDLDGYWQVLTRLTWTPNRQRSSQAAFELDGGGPAVLVLDDEVVVDDGSSLQVLYSKVNRGSSNYRGEIADRLSRLYTTRTRLVEDSNRRPGNTLLERTARRLRIAEVEAQIDALTEGAVARWRADPTNFSTEP